MDIRTYIINNFKDSSTNEIKDAIEASIKEKDEVTLPGLGVFLEILWSYSDNENKEYIVNTLKKGL